MYIQRESREGVRERDLGIYIYVRVSLCVCMR